MAVFKLSSPLIKVAVSLALLLNVIILSGAYPSTSVDEKEDGAQDQKKPINSIYWRKYWDDLLEHDYDFETVFEKLSMLKAFFDTHLVPKDWIHFKSLLNDLVKIREPDNKLCKDGLITRIGGFIQRQHRDGAIQRYAKHYGHSLLETCNQLIVADAKKAIKDMKQLDSCDYEHDSYLLRDHLKAIIEAAPEKRLLEMNYVEEYANAINMLLSKYQESEGAQMKPYIVYEKHVIEPCKFWIQATDRLRRLYKFLNSDTIDEELKSSIEYADICDYIMTTKKGLLKRLFILT